MNSLIFSIVAIILTPFLGGIILGVDRILTAKMQSRIGPPLFQPFYDILKLFEKQNLVVNPFQFNFVVSAVIFTLLSAALFFLGQNLLITLFALVVGNVFLVLAAYTGSSPYSLIGAERELIQMLATEPMILLTAVGFYMVTGSFDISAIASTQAHSILYLPGIFIGLTYVLTVKLRKSPFDLATSHHAHQEIVKGLTTEFAGPTLALFEIIHLYETVIFMGLIYLFFASMPVVGIIVAIAIYFLEILIDNINARVKWELMLGSSWIITVVLGVGNIVILYFVQQVMRL